MKAAIVTDFALPPRYGDFPDPVPDEAHQVVTVLAAAVHQIVRGRASGRHYSSTDALPLVPGVDCVGRVADGRRVYTGGTEEPYGTLAELAPVPLGWEIPVPDALDDATAAAVVNPATSSWLPLAPLLKARPGATVLIHGATGVSGLLAVQVARLLGAGRVIAAGRSRAGLAVAQDRGADALLALDEPLAPQLAEAAPSGVDVVIDYLWGERTRDLLLALLPTDREPDAYLDLVEVGSMAGPSVQVDAAWLRSRPLRISGSGLGSVGPRAMFAAAGGVLRAAAEGRLSIDVVTRPLADVADAWSFSDRLVLIP